MNSAFAQTLAYHHYTIDASHGSMSLAPPKSTKGVKSDAANCTPFVLIVLQSFRICTASYLSR